jgi:hypothetical protein
MIMVHAMTDRIHVADQELRVVVLPPSDYYRFTGALTRRPEFSDAHAFDDFINEKRSTEEALRRALSHHWRPFDDFEVGDDGNIAFTLCGGVYSKRVICRDYLALLYLTLQDTRMKEAWAYATAIELQEPIDGMSLCDFVLQGNQVSVNGDLDGFDFVRYFSRSKADAAK